MHRMFPLAVLIFCFYPGNAPASSASDIILGKWQSMSGNVTVEVFKEGETFKAKLISFDDTDDISKPMNARLDDMNPDGKLKNRKILGLDIVTDLIYNYNDRRWENGTIYDTRSGKSWSANAIITPGGLLQVKGYWKFEFLSKSAKFRRVG